MFRELFYVYLSLRTHTETLHNLSGRVHLQRLVSAEVGYVHLQRLVSGEVDFKGGGPHKIRQSRAVPRDLNICFDF